MLQCDAEPLTGDQTSAAASSEDSAAFSVVWKSVNATVALRRNQATGPASESFACGGKTSACIRTSSTKQARGDKENLYSALRSAFFVNFCQHYLCVSHATAADKWEVCLGWPNLPRASHLRVARLRFYCRCRDAIRHNAMGVLRGGGSGVCRGPVVQPHTVNTQRPPGKYAN